MKVEKIDIKNIKPAAYNPRKDLTPQDKEYTEIKNSLDTFGVLEPIVWNKRTGNIIGGHQRFKILKERGEKEVFCTVVDFDEDKEKAANIALNKVAGEWDEDLLNDLLVELQETDFDMLEFGFDFDELEKDATQSEKHGKLNDKFVVPPFSILDTRQGYWQDRKETWYKLINDNGESRIGTLGITALANCKRFETGVSILDPVLAEIIVRWFGTSSDGGGYRRRKSI